MKSGNVFCSKSGRKNPFFAIRQLSWLRQYVTSRKVAGSRPDGDIKNFQFTYSFYSCYDPEVYSASKVNEYQKMFLWSKAWPTRNADNLTAIYEPIAKKIWDS
jgi:hypothetical protein